MLFIIYGTLCILFFWILMLQWINQSQVYAMYLKLYSGMIKCNSCRYDIRV